MSEMMEINELENKLKYLEEKLEGYWYPFKILDNNTKLMSGLFQELIEEYRTIKEERKQLEEKFKEYMNRQLEIDYEDKQVVNEILKKNKILSETRQYLKSLMYKERNLLENIVKLSESVIQSPEKMQNILNQKEKNEIEKEKVQLKINENEEQGISISGLSYQDLIDLQKKINNVESEK